MRVTQQQIAEAAGVSQTTVSMVLRNRKGFYCSPEVRGRVLRTIRRLDYAVPHRRTYNLGLMLHASGAEAHRAETHAYRLFHGAAERAATLNYDVLIVPHVAKTWPPTAVKTRKVDGLIVQSHVIAGQLAGQQDTERPVVLLNCSDETGALSSVMPDNAGGLTLCVRHLHALGHRRIGYFGLPGAPIGSIHHHERYRGFCDAMRALDLEVPPELMRLFPFKPANQDELEQMTAEVVDHFAGLPAPPTAVLSNGDVFMLAFLHAARQRNWRIPEELSVIGFDNSEACAHSQPPLSSIDQPMEQMAAAAVDELVGLIEGRTPQPRQLRYPVELVLRASTAPPA